MARGREGGRRVTLLPGTTSLHVNRPIGTQNKRADADSCFALIGAHRRVVLKHNETQWHFTYPIYVASHSRRVYKSLGKMKENYDEPRSVQQRTKLARKCHDMTSLTVQLSEFHTPSTLKMKASTNSQQALCRKICVCLPHPASCI